MDVAHIKVGHALLKNLSQLREQKGAFSLEDVWTVFKQVAASPPAVEADHCMHQEIARLARHIATVKQEIANFCPAGPSQTMMTDASQHLEEVIRSSEKASHIIIDATEAIQAAAKDVSGEKRKTIRDATARIYEACNFQDINGQHITRVIKMLNTIEQSINRINALFPAAAPTDPAHSLLNGPQLEAEAPTQEDIDKLFATLSPHF